MAHPLATYLAHATTHHWAVPHFNISNLEQLRGIAEAASELKAPVMIGTSENERNRIGLGPAVALVDAYQKQFRVPLFLNADHTKSVTAAKAAIDAGYRSIHIDLSKLPYIQNLKGTREVVRYAKKKHGEVSVEGELGYLATDSSKIYKGKIAVDPRSFTKPDEAVAFVYATGINRLGPAVGNFHGMAANKKQLDFELIAKLRAAIPQKVALVLHGGSGDGGATFKHATRAGIANIHISTELRLAYTKTLRETLKKNPDELTPYILTAPSVEATKKKAAEFIKLFGANGKA